MEQHRHILWWSASIPRAIEDDVPDKYSEYTIVNETKDKTTILDKFKCGVALEGQAPPYSTTVSLLVIILG